MAIIHTICSILVHYSDGTQVLVFYDRVMKERTSPSPFKRRYIILVDSGMVDDMVDSGIWVYVSNALTSRIINLVAISRHAFDVNELIYLIEYFNRQLDHHL